MTEGILAKGFSTLGAEFIEQPLANAHDSDLSRSSYAIPIIADESCVLEEDVERLSRNFDGINVKLVKCGGLTPALRMIRRAGVLGMRTMVGCMLEARVLIAAGCVAAQHADYATSTGPGSLPTIRAPADGSSVESFIVREQLVLERNRDARLTI